MTIDFDFEIRWDSDIEMFAVIGVQTKHIYMHCKDRESALSWAETLRQDITNLNRTYVA
jgi:hypothetical protein